MEEQNALEQARLALEQDRQARMDEFAAILQRESARLRITLVASVEKVALGNGVFGDRAKEALAVARAEYAHLEFRSRGRA